MKSWEKFFTESKSFDWSDKALPFPKFKINNIFGLKKFLDMVHIRQCLIRPFLNSQAYPLVESRELLPSFESDLYEYENLPGFSLVAFDRQLDYFNEVFQFDIIHNCWEKSSAEAPGVCPLFRITHQNNLSTFQSRLPRNLQEPFGERFTKRDVSRLINYPSVLDFILDMDRGHVMALNARNEFYLAGVYGSFPSDLDQELKRFGLRIGKFSPNNNQEYERNRGFVYQFLMELYGYPVVSERRTSAALFARRLFKTGEHFLIRALGQTDRTITTLYSTGEQRFYPALEKLALVRVETRKKETIQYLKENGFFLDYRKRAVILRIKYKQHKYDPNNIREERALSVQRQEIIHPLTGEICSHLNIIKDTSYMTLILNDIVRGEYSGRVKYKREIVENTESHEKRLKFLYAWLSKHQRRIIGYSDEFFASVIKVLDHYLLNPDYREVFNDLHKLHREVWNKYSYIKQARKIRILEELLASKYISRKINYLTVLENISQILGELKFELADYYDEMVCKTISMLDRIVNDPYLLKRYIHVDKQDSLTEYGQKVRKTYGRIVSHLDELRSIRKCKSEQTRKDSP